MLPLYINSKGNMDFLNDSIKYLSNSNLRVSYILENAPVKKVDPFHLTLRISVTLLHIIFGLIFESQSASDDENKNCV